MHRYCDAVIDGKTLYIRSKGSISIYSYDATSVSWSRLPDAIHEYGSIAVVNGLLTTVGGLSYSHSNELFSLTGEGSGRRWTKKFPLMPTERCRTIALCTGTTLIVTGGWAGAFSGALSTVEVMDTETHQWSTATELPQPMYSASATVCGDQFYMLGGLNKDRADTKSVYTCSVSALLQSCVPSSMLKGTSLKDKGRLWRPVASLPVTQSTCESFHGQLLAIGGVDSGKSTTAVYMYNSTAKCWKIISHMTTGRWSCFTAVLPDNRLMVVGGTTDGIWSDAYTVEIASICT